MTLSEIRDFTRIMLGETDSSNSYVDNTEVDSAINIALTRVSIDTEALMTFSTDSTDVGVERYSLPFNFSQILQLEIDITSTLSRPLVQKDLDEYSLLTYGNRAMQGQPVFYKIEIGATDVVTSSPGDLWLYPVPDDNGGADYVLRVRYNKQPTALTDDAHMPELHPSLHEAIAHKACQFLSRKHSDGRRYMEFENSYNVMIRSYMDSKASREASAFIPKNVYGRMGNARTKPQGWR